MAFDALPTTVAAFCAETPIESDAMKATSSGAPAERVLAMPDLLKQKRRGYPASYLLARLHRAMFGRSERVGMSPSASTLQSLESRIDAIAKEIGGEALAVSLYDYETGVAWSCQGDRWFHSASTIKVAVLFALFGALDAGRFTLDSRLHVRNRFLSTVDGTPFRVSAARDGDRAVHDAVGKTMRIDELARHMIVTSSNLATNLLVDLIGVEMAQQMLARYGITGVELARGVEDEKAFEESFNNRVTANGLVDLFRVIREGRGVLEQ